MKSERCLEQAWRWFGPNDPVPLAHVRQAGATGVVTALHEVANGEVWSVEQILARKEIIERAGLRWSVVESVPVHEDIKQAKGAYERYLSNYAQSLRNLAACGIQTVCYNFMPLLDWTRTDLEWVLPDGSQALRCDAVDLALFDLFILQGKGAATRHSQQIAEQAEARLAKMSNQDKEKLARTILLGLPGTVEDLSLEDFRLQLAQYEQIDSKALRANHAAFLRAVVPVAEECGVRLCIHPDDPPFSIFGLPRIASTLQDLEAILEAVDSYANGITFCSGSLGANPKNDLPAMFRKLGSRVHFLHLRNVKRESDGSFFEADHLAGSTDMAELMLAVVEELDSRDGGEQLPMRPDHGHRMLDDLEKQGCYPGYTAIGRLRGLAELRGLELGIMHMRDRAKSQ